MYRYDIIMLSFFFFFIKIEYNMINVCMYHGLNKIKLLSEMSIYNEKVSIIRLLYFIDKFSFVSYSKTESYPYFYFHYSKIQHVTLVSCYILDQHHSL